MTAADVVAPTGYERHAIGDAVVVARTAAVESLRRALALAPSLHAWAASTPGGTAFQGRATAWGVQLPGSSLDVVVRHAQRGGLLAALRGDRYVWPGRAPWELATALKLEALGVRTPDVVAYALYPAGRGFCRCDVLTRRLPAGAAFPEAWKHGSPEAHEELLVAVAAMLRDLRAAGAKHPDLNAKNLYVARVGERWQAWVLDVDRVRFLTPSESWVGAPNLARLVRSLRKLRDRDGLAISDVELARLAALVEGGA